MGRLTEMQVFVRVVETGSFSRAARELKLTQPTVTKHIMSIESRLGVRLLNRNPRSTSLTEVGALYYGKCKDVLREFEEAQNVVRMRHDKLEGLLRVGTSLTFGWMIVDPMVFEFMRENPDLQVEVNHDDRYVDMVAQGIDVAIRLGKLADSSLGGRFLGSNPWVMVASPAYLEQHGEPRGPGDLAGHACLIYSTVQGSDHWRLRAPSGDRVSVFIKGYLRSNNLSSLVAAARAGMGITLVPHYVAAAPLRAGKLVQVMASYGLAEQEIHAVYPSPRLVPAKVTAFIAFAQERLRGDWWLKDWGAQPA